MDFIKKNWKGFLVCMVIAVPSWFLGKEFKLVGGAVFAMVWW